MKQLDIVRVTLHNNHEAKEDYTLAYQKYIESLCKTEIEKAIVLRVLSEAIPEALFRRRMAHLQNTL